MAEQICVCCGGPVRVVSDGEGTSHYESLADEQLAAVEAERDRLLVLVAYMHKHICEGAACMYLNRNRVSLRLWRGEQARRGSVIARKIEKGWHD